MSTRIKSLKHHISIQKILTHLDHRVARPSAKAFLIAYLYVTLPRIFNIIIVLLRKKQYHKIPGKVWKVLISALNPSKFPSFGARLVAGINLLEPIFYGLLKSTKLSKSPVKSLFISTFLLSFVSSIVMFPHFQNHILSYGRNYSLDLTLLVATRAMDTALSTGLAKILPLTLANHANASLFIVSCTFIMFSWFYRPHALPPAYRKWITLAANMDQEILDSLYFLREGKLKYGQESEKMNILKPYCERYGEDYTKVGDFVKGEPLPCRTVHAFISPNCEIHALWRFYRGFSFAIKVYGPLNILMLLFPSKIGMKKRILQALKSSLRSSAFLGTFIGFYWYAVCLTRTRLGPFLFPKIPRTYWDDTIGPLMGSIACGFSSYIERDSRRKELALFVAPRALGTLVPVEPTKRNLYSETGIFALSMAILVAYSRHNLRSVRGIFGRGLEQIFSIRLYS